MTFAYQRDVGILFLNGQFPTTFFIIFVFTKVFVKIIATNIKIVYD